MANARIISAIGTPLNDGDELHVEGLRKHLEEQSTSNIDGVLVAGTMGLMQLLSDSAYHDLIQESCAFWKDNGEVLVGVGDASLSRTLARVRMVNELPVDGMVVLSPYFVTFSQAELIDYFHAVADASRVPMFLYDLPQRTRTTLEFETVMTLAEHPNIVGIKCSGDIDQAKLLITAVEGSGFRVVVAQPLLLDSLLREGIMEHLDGVYSLAPQLTREIVAATEREDWSAAREGVHRIEQLLATMHEFGIFPAMTALLNERGIPGRFGPRPFHMLPDHARRRLLTNPSVAAVFGDDFLAAPSLS